MKTFLDQDFLLSNATAVTLYEQYAKDMPIIDYHCHISPEQIYRNQPFRNITDIWLGGDHYKWRLMRANGVDEAFITGDASDYDKFMAWAKTVPMTIGNPLYHWSHLELRRFFGIDTLLDETTAPAIWEKTNTMLQSDGFRPRDFITKSNVEVVCTTDDPADTLEYHVKLKDDQTFPVKVVPAFRPDKALRITADTFVPWLHQLEETSGRSIPDYAALLDALTARAEFFHEVGCRTSDHALDTVPYEPTTFEEAAAIFEKALKHEPISLLEENKYRTYTLVFLGKLYARLGWVMQLHMHAARNNNTRMFQRLGPDTGNDAMYDGQLALSLGQLLDTLEQEDGLPKTILYSLNPKDFPVLAAWMGSFQGGGIPGKMQLGAAWWFNDTKAGMLNQMQVLADIGLLSRFVGMLTDSRSFLSYPRHEYFRRLLCDLFGRWVEQGEAPNDMALLGQIIQGICYNNAKAYFQFS
ncbi:glucuronate isomerase [Alicyclobacillus cycloheptanicus]|uniref:Uronate isomerase n=1 Tax=Alicyclobacillus cycloheptanicus TaxID=1457 RepID=A0ABT9XEX0_9BACL|nr:glucuronate isomerase [Alicyclobacillus cycloheptanicus]MDQ0188827.1 glucuronate isomerase [Alicyclobacillus cycloheptanicus]WDM00526.1 glucuronate isomerase [Alicyclobacillus cycloheptanicus]